MVDEVDPSDLDALAEDGPKEWPLSQAHEELGAELRRMRERAGVTLSDMASNPREFRGASYSTASRVERGLRTPSRRFIDIWVYHFGGSRTKLYDALARLPKKGELARLQEAPREPTGSVDDGYRILYSTTRYVIRSKKLDHAIVTMAIEFTRTANHAALRSTEELYSPTDVQDAKGNLIIEPSFSALVGCRYEVNALASGAKFDGKPMLLVRERLSLAPVDTSPGAIHVASFITREPGLLTTEPTGVQEVANVWRQSDPEPHFEIDFGGELVDLVDAFSQDLGLLDGNIRRITKPVDVHDGVAVIAFTKADARETYGVRWLYV